MKYAAVFVIDAEAMRVEREVCKLTNGGALPTAPSAALSRSCPFKTTGRTSTLAGEPGAWRPVSVTVSAMRRWTN